MDEVGKIPNRRTQTPSLIASVRLVGGRQELAVTRLATTPDTLGPYMILYQGSGSRLPVPPCTGP